MLMNCVFDSCSEAVNYTMKNKLFGVYCSDTNSPNPNVHIHECCEIFLCLKGGKSFLIDNTIYDINDGDLLVINQYEAHKVVAGDNKIFSRYILHIHPSFLHECSLGGTDLSGCFYGNDKVTKISLTKKDTEKLVSLFEEIKKGHPLGDDVYKKLRATELILETNRIFSCHRGDFPAEFSHKTVQLAIDYINSNYSSPLSLDTVAKNAFISPTQLSRLFNRYCGTTVTKYITGKRITEAKKLLSQGTSVTDAAFMCGFNDYANFIRTFKKAVGVPPGKYKSLSL